MKKYIITLCLVLASVCASAQLNVKTPIHPKTEVIAYSRGLSAQLVRVGETYHLYLKSTNQFDDTTQSFCLGNGETAAAKTLGDMLSLFSDMAVGESVTVEDGLHHEVFIQKYTKKFLYFRFDLQAGDRYLKNTDATYFIKMLGYEMQKKVGVAKPM